MGTELRMVASNYGAHELWPGPLTSGGELPDPANCTAYDRIYRVTRADIDAFARTGALTNDLRDWPASLGAPVVDGDGTPGNYNLAGGDRPEVLGTETAWWVMNDVGNAKRTTQTKPLGLEVRVAAFALSSANPVVDRTTLYRYTLVYRGSAPLTGAYFGLWMDPDLGNASDDYVGSDSGRGLAYVYNGDDLDEGTDGYGPAPPALGLRYLEGPLVAAPGQTWTDADGTVHRDRRRLTLSGALINSGGASNDGNPRSGTTDWYNYLRSHWQNGAPIRACGNGSLNSTARPECESTRFMYSGDPVTLQGWSERNIFPGVGHYANAPSDRNLLASVGPFAMQPGETQSITFALVYARGTSNLNSVTALKTGSDRLQALWNSGAFHRGFDGAGPVAVTAAPVLRAPGNGAADQPSRVRLFWDALDGDFGYEVEASHDPAFPRGGTVVSRPSGPALEVVPDSSGRPLYWRVRGVLETSVGGPSVGPWSSMWTFTSTPRTVSAPALVLNFLTTANAAGPLVPPEPASLASAGFTAAAGLAGQPNGMRQQAPGGLLATQGWSLFTFGAHSTYTSWIARVSRDGGNLDAIYASDFEWRFTGSSRALLAFDGSGAEVMTVPFELWSLGADATSPADDVRMIPWLCESACGAGRQTGVFDLGGDSPVSSGSDDPISDAVYLHYPIDRTPGQVGYHAYANGPNGAIDVSKIGDEVWARMTLVGVNFGAAGAAYPMALPERGTVFQIRRGLIPARHPRPPIRPTGPACPRQRCASSGPPMTGRRSRSHETPPSLTLCATTPSRPARQEPATRCRASRQA